MVERFETSSGLQAHRGGIKYNFKKHTKMEKKFILKSQLEEIVGHLMEKGIEHADKIQIDITLRRRGSDEMVLDVKVWDATTFDTVAKNTYTIVPDVEDEFDVDDDTIGLALAKIEGRYQAIKDIATLAESTNTPNE